LFKELLEFKSNNEQIANFGSLSTAVIDSFSQRVSLIHHINQLEASYEPKNFFDDLVEPDEEDDLDNSIDVQNQNLTT
jgi:hypothetical protein